MTSPIGLARTNAAKTYAARAPDPRRCGSSWTTHHHMASPGDEVHRVLEVEERARVLERRVVDPGQVPDHVVREPERERDGRMGERADGAVAGDRCGERGRDREHDEKRRPLGEHDVLQQMHRQEVVHPERVDRRHADREQHRHRAEEARDPPGRCVVSGGSRGRRRRSVRGRRAPPRSTTTNTDPRRYASRTRV